jgi:hypothetical protein
VVMSTEEPKGYQGWKNYETWAVHLWISNDQGTHEAYDEAAEDFYAEAVRDQLKSYEFDPGDDPRKQIDRKGATEEAAHQLAERLKDDLDDSAELPRQLDGTVYADLLNAALGEVDWHEVAESYVENIDRDETEADVAGEFAPDDIGGE